MEMTVQHPVDLYLIGVGISFPDDLTIKTLEVMTACRRIFTNIPQQNLDQLPDDISKKCVCLLPLYKEERRRFTNYEEVAKEVINALDDSKPLAWLTRGHPLVFDSVSHILLNDCKKNGLVVRAVPGISSIDTLLIDLNYDPARGLFIHDATSVVKRQIKLITSAATILLQPSVFNTDYPRMQYPASNLDLSELRDHLSRFYPLNHKCAFVRSSSSSNGHQEITWIEIGDINSIPIEVINGSTLFIPSIET